MTTLATLKQSAANARKKADAAEQMVVRKTVMGLTGSGLAYGQRKGMPLAVFGVPTKLAVAAVASLAEIMTRGSTQRFASAVGDASIAVYSFTATLNKSFVAGLQPVGDDEGDDGGEL